MKARRHDDVTAIASGIESRCEAHAVANRDARYREEQMAPPAPRDRLDGGRQFTALVLQVEERIITTVSRINIEHEEARGRSGGHADVGLRVPLPPGSNCCFVSRRVLHAMRDGWMFSEAGAGLEVPTRATSFPITADRSVDRQHWPAELLRISQSRHQHRWVALLLLRRLSHGETP
jgi:hypothetical protein